MLAELFAGPSWWPRSLARGPGQVCCLRCGGSAGTWAAMLVSACPGWRERLPARGQAMLLLGDLRCAGGSVAEFAGLAARRIAQLPEVPDKGAPRRASAIAPAARFARQKSVETHRR